MKVQGYVATGSALLLGLTEAQDVQCKEGIHIIGARGSYERPGFGIIGGVVNGSLDRIPNSDAIPVPYPASINDPLYAISQPQGVGNMTELLMEYVDACPDGRIALMGYSQGAQVTADVLVGNVNPEFGERPAIDSKYTKNVVAVILMGDPTFVVNQPINAGNSTKDGVFPRQNPDWEEDGLADRTQSYCDEGDFFCAQGEGDDALAIHLRYVAAYGDHAVDFIASKFSEAVSSTPSSISSSTPSGTPSGSAMPTTLSPSSTPTLSDASPPPTSTGGAEQLRAGSLMVAAFGLGAAVVL